MIGPRIPADAGQRLASDVLAPMKRAFVGKDEVIDLLGACLVAGEHLFILGPPGTAKSALVHDLGRRLDGRTFDYLLTRFTEPNELFGPFDIRRLREGELLTNTEGMLPEASLVFLDELLNANSAILNSLLMVLNERVFRRGKETVELPLLMAVGASNRLPEDDALSALFDRFLLRVHCENVADERLRDVLEAGWKLESRAGVDGPRVDVTTIRELQRCVSAVDLAGVLDDYTDLVRRLRAAGIAVSDRRAVKLQRLVAASAVLCGRATASASDFWVLQYIWDREEQEEVLRSIVQDALRKGDGSGTDGSGTDGMSRHPRSLVDDRPDPEIIARDLESISTELDRDGDGSPRRAVLEDRLSALASRCQWVADENQRAFLENQIERLWRRFAEVGGR